MRSRQAEGETLVCNAEHVGFASALLEALGVLPAPRINGVWESFTPLLTFK